MRAEEIAKTLIDIQCQIYERHGATGAPTSRDEYERWVCEATDIVTQLYGSVDMGRYGLEMGKALQMTTDMNAHIAAEALERALASEETNEEADPDSPISSYDDICDEITNLTDERAVISQAIAVEMRRLVDIAWGTLREKCDDDADISETLNMAKPVECIMPKSDRILIIYGLPGFDVPETDRFRCADGLESPPDSRIEHVTSMDGSRTFDRVILRRRVADAEETVAICSSELLTQPNYVIRQLLMEPQGESMSVF